MGVHESFTAPPHSTQCRGGGDAGFYIILDGLCVANSIISKLMKYKRFRTGEIKLRQEWSRMVSNGSERSRTVPNSLERSQTIPNSPKRSQTVSNSPELSQMVPNDPERSQTVSNGPELSQIVPNNPERFRTVLNSPKCTLWGQRCSSCTTHSFVLSCCTSKSLIDLKFSK